MTETTRTREIPTEPQNAPPGVDPDRRLKRFVKIGSIILAICLVAFVGLYLKDQLVIGAPSIVDQQIARAEAAVRQSPNNVAARLSLAVAYEEKNRLDDALAQYGEILKVDPANLDGIMGKGHALLTKGDLDGATVEYTKVVESKRTGEFAGADTRLQASYYYLGVIALKQGKPPLAIERLDQALQIEPTDSDAMYQIGLAQAQLGNHAGAIAMFKKALTFVPTGWCEPYQQIKASYTALNQPEEASYSAAMDLYCQKKPDQAKQQLTALTSGAAGVDAMLGLALIAQVEKDNAGAVAWYQKVLAADPKNITAMSYLAALGVTPSPAATPKK
jgi:tetratricopeptide (TPR) repeat protein